MDVIGKELLKGTVEGQIKKLAGDDKPDMEEDAESGLSKDDEEMLRNQMHEKTEQMLKVQAKRRTERAKAREEIRQKHNLKSSEDDQKILEDAATASRFGFTDTDGENGMQQVANAVLTKLKDTWDNVKNAFDET